METIRSFDVLSQRSVEQLEYVQIFPASELILDDRRLHDGLKRMKTEADRVSGQFREQGNPEAANRIGAEIARILEEARELHEQRQREVQGIRSKHEKELKESAMTSARTLKEREEALQRELTDTRDQLTRQLQETKTESAGRQEALEKAEEEIKKLRSQCDIAKLNEENTRKKLTALQADFKDKLAADTLQYREQAEQAKQELEKTQDELISLQETEDKRLRAAAKVRGTMQELMQQYGRFGQSLEEAAEQMRSLED